MTHCRKVPYGSESQARKAISNLKAATGQTEYLKAYRCPNCRQWHYGHPRPQDQKAHEKRQGSARNWRREKRSRKGDRSFR
jgi:hypothetical protein